MKNVFKTVTALLLSVIVVFAVGCTKPVEPNDGGNNNGENGGSNGGEVNGVNLNGHNCVDLGLPSGTLFFCN